MTALTEVLEKLERATPGPWECGAGKAYEPATTVYCDDALGSAVATCAHSMTALIPASQEKANAEAIAAAVNFLREHGPALLRDAGDGSAALGLLSRMRFACGDNGLRMQDELEEYLRRLAEDAARYRWLRTVTPYRFKKLQDACIADATDTTYFLGDKFDAAIDAAMHAPGGAGGG